MALRDTSFNAADRTSPAFYGPPQTALLLLDFHATLVERAGGLQALQVAANMRTWAKAKGMRVIHCLVDAHSLPFATCKDAGRLAHVAEAMRSSGGGEEAAPLRVDAQDEPVFTRRIGYVSALQSPNLGAFLQANGIRSLVLTGLSTSGCVLRTAVAATDAEYVVTVIADGCADPDDGVHDMLVEKVLGHRGYVASRTEFQHEFERLWIWDADLSDQQPMHPTMGASSSSPRRSKYP